ncbi:MAG: universal stress protein [Anaerolineaceae bacterium]|nr:universal stress protein [Anaerolineaceae bacterium]
MSLDKDKDHKQGLQLLACLSQQANSSGELFAYVQQVAHFLQAKLAWQTGELNSLAEIAESSSPRYDLLLFNETGWHSLTRPYFQTAVSLPRVKPSILLIREPRWPLQRLLLILRGEATDKATIDWGLKLTKHNNCMVTLLVVRPPSEAQKDQFGLLKANTIAGRHLRTALHQFVTHQINGVLKVSHGSPEYIIQQEVAGTAYDLIVLGSEPECRLFYWRLDSLLEPLLQWTKQSILIAKPIYPETIQQKNHLVNLQG